MNDSDAEIKKLRDDVLIHKGNVQALEVLSAQLRENCEKLTTLIADALKLKAGWKEAIVELEDFCKEPVRLKNMVAAADQLDDWAKRARKLVPNN